MAKQPRSDAQRAAMQSVDHLRDEITKATQRHKATIEILTEGLHLAKQRCEQVGVVASGYALSPVRFNRRERE